MGRRIVDVVVGDEKETFSVHENLIRTSSPFFDKALTGAWRESSQRTIQLPEDEPKIFAIYVHWLYNCTLPVFCNEPDLAGNSEYVEIVKAYVLGDKLLDAAFQNTAIDAIIEKSVTRASDGCLWHPVAEAIEYAFNESSESAPIRDLLVDMYLYKGGGKWLYDWGKPENLPQPFLLKLAAKLLDDRGASIGKRLDPSNYHCDASDDEVSPKQSS